MSFQQQLSLWFAAAYNYYIIAVVLYQKFYSCYYLELMKLFNWKWDVISISWNYNVWWLDICTVTLEQPLSCSHSRATAVYIRSAVSAISQAEPIAIYFLRVIVKAYSYSRRCHSMAGCSAVATGIYKKKRHSSELWSGNSRVKFVVFKWKLDDSPDALRHL